MKGFLFILSIFALAALTHAQLSRDEPLDPSANPRNQQLNSGSPADEMRYRAAVRHDEENHKEMVERAEEIEQTGQQLLKTFEQQMVLDRDDLKKLERMEKLARKVRGRAGGSDSDVPLDNPPAQLDKALTRLAELSGQLNECVKKTSRLVVSATVIEHSNELIQLIRHIRTFAQP